MDNKWAMLCKLVTQPFDDPKWAWERKLDGERIKLTIKSGKVVTLTARSGTDKTDHFPEIRPWLTHEDSIVLDGEITCSSFQDLQKRVNRLKDREQLAKDYPATYNVFDILELNGHDMRDKNLAVRRMFLRALDEMLSGAYNIKVTDWCESGVKAFELAKAQQWEGVVGKAVDDLYFPNKRLWVKVKTWHEDDFDIIGYTEGTGKRAGYFGALLLGNPRVDEDGPWDYYCGDVGTGFTDKDLADLTPKLKANLLNTDEHANWLKVAMPCHIKYLEVTNKGLLRFPVFKGLK